MKAFITLVCLVAVAMAQTTTTTTRRPVPTRPPTTTEPPVDCDISVGEDDWAVLVPNPKSCESYYVCDAGVPILMLCPEGLHFNAELSVCDWPSEAKCTVGEWRNQRLLPK